MSEINFKMSKPKKDSYKSFLGNKKEGQGFADKRKRKAAYDYLKLLKKEKKSFEHTGDTSSAPKHQQLDFLHSQIKSPHKGNKKHAFSAAQKIAKKKQEEKKAKKEKYLKSKQERDVALDNYKSKKKETHLKLCKRTSRGQPVMKHQMELLLGRIQRQKEVKEGGGSG